MHFPSPNLILGAAVLAVVLAAVMVVAALFAGPDTSGLLFFSLQCKERKLIVGLCGTMLLGEVW